MKNKGGRRKIVLPMEQIISDYESGLSCEKIAKKYGVSTNTIYKRIYETQKEKKEMYSNTKLRIDAKTITSFKNNADRARNLIASNKATSLFSGEITEEGTEIVFIPQFGIITKSEFELFKKQFC